MTHTDLAGQELNVGDKIVVAFRMGNSAELRVGRILAFTERKGSYGSNPTPLMEMDWITGSAGYGMPDTSKIEMHKRYYKVPDLDIAV